MARTASKNSRRRWLQFSLRTLLVALTFLAILLGGWVNRARRQREAVAAIRAANGTVFYAYECGLTRDFTDAGLVHLVPLKRLTDLAIWDSQINGTGLEHLRGLTELDSLDLRGAWVDDGVLLQAADIRSLKSITIVDANVTDVGLSHLTKLTSLESLVLSGTHVTDEGRRAFRQAMPNCKLE